MTSDTPDERSDAEKALLTRLTRPMPVQARRELDLCVTMDSLAVSLDSTRAILAAALSRPAEMSNYASPAALQAGWKDGLAEVTAAFGQTDQLARALIRSVKITLALE